MCVRGGGERCGVSMENEPEFGVMLQFYGGCSLNGELEDIKL